MKTEAIDRGLFDELAGRTGNDLISIYIPTHRFGREVSQDRIRFKNQLSSASDQLEGRGWKPRERSDRLESAENLLDDREFWEHQSNGLAVFIDDLGAVTTVSLSVESGPSCTVMPVFLLRLIAAELERPMVPVLALTRGFVGLYETDSTSVMRIDSDLPGSFEDVNWFVDREKQRQQHPYRAGATGRHGHEPALRETEDTRRFVREVADALPGGEQGSPLVVLGDVGLISRFQSETNRHVISPENSGLSSPITDSQILDLAAPAVTELEREQVARAISRAQEQLGLGNASTDIGTALGDAMSGRLGEVVFQRDAEPIWGRVDEGSLEVTVMEDRSAVDVDLLDRLIVATIASGGEAHAAPSPVEGRPFLAIRRF
ncbi:MAG: hypothetical protein PVF87_03770 [Acidimicrobiia bacterium]|jgi:hypothetical protein